MRKIIPLKERPLDYVFLIFFYVNIIFITYLFDIEQLVIGDTSNFTYPVWPPRFVIDLAHWYGNNFDPALMARPPWWQATIWIDQLFFGPYYIFAIYAFTKGKEWIRIPSIVFASVMMTNVTIILFEEFFGNYASPAIFNVLAANASWIIIPALLIWRLRNDHHPFSRAAEDNKLK